MEDASNKLKKYQRNIVRHDLVPVIRTAVNPSVERTLARTAEVFRAFEEYHRAVEEKRYAEAADESGTGVSLAVQLLKGYFEAESLLVIRRALQCIGCERAGYEHVHAVYGLLEASTGTKIELPGGAIALRERNVILCMPGTVYTDDPVTVQMGETVKALGLQFSSRFVDSNQVEFTRNTSTEYVDFNVAGDTWLLRRWKPGDSFQPIGFQGNVNVSDYLTDMKISTAAKPQVVVLEKDESIIWVCGLRLDDHYKIRHRTESIVELSIKSLTEDELET
jgi:tRNA(Ile)-lysidine synthase